MADHPKGAILQRDKQTYAIVPRTPVGIVTPDDLESIARVARKYKIPVIKITSGQRFALVGLQKEDVDPIWDALNMDVGKAVELCLHYVQACPGTAVCKFGVQDSLGIGMEIESFFSSMDLPAKVKIGVSGCPFCCGESFVRDLGMFEETAERMRAHGRDVEGLFDEPMLLLRNQGQVLGDDFLIALGKDVGAALEEQHAEDVFLELRGVHFAAQDVGGGEEVAFKLG